MIKLDKDHLDQVERDIRPPMATAITIPVTENDREVAIIYVCVSPFKRGISDEKLTEIAEALTLGDHDESNDDAICQDIDAVLQQRAADRPGSSEWREPSRPWSRAKGRVLQKS